jgi:molecular chaperone DnaJ
VLLEIKEDERFERSGDDLVFDLPLSFSQAALGGDFVVPSATGEEQITIPSGTQTGTVIRLRGKGLPHLGHDGKGDLHVRIHVWTPESLTGEQERLFRELAKLEGDPPKRSSGFWTRVKEALRA